MLKGEFLLEGNWLQPQKLGLTRDQWMGCCEIRRWVLLLAVVWGEATEIRGCQVLGGRINLGSVGEASYHNRDYLVLDPVG